jgi:hypothetical protein
MNLYTNISAKALRMKRLEKLEPNDVCRYDTSELGEGLSAQIKHNPFILGET